MSVLIPIDFNSSSDKLAEIFKSKENDLVEYELNEKARNLQVTFPGSTDIPTLDLFNLSKRKVMVLVKLVKNFETNLENFCKPEDVAIIGIFAESIRSKLKED